MDHIVDLPALCAYDTLTSWSLRKVAGGQQMRISELLKGPRRVRRLAHIARKFASHGLGFLVSRLNIPGFLPSRIGLPLAQRRPVDPAELPARLARVLEELGPTFVKFGQMLVSRPDVLPADYITELKRICHRVAPFPSEVALSIAREELGGPLEETFRGFSKEPRASGSIAQIHDAELLNGTPVVVKLRRPGIEKTIDDDLAIMEFLASQADNMEDFRPLRLPMLVAEFGRGIRGELNFLNEAAHTHRFHSDFQDDEHLKIPQVFWECTTDRMLTLERIEGTSLAGMDWTDRGQQEKSRIARTILDAFLEQFFQNGSFHGDPHPGNIILLDGGRIGLIDFGLVGRLSDALRRQLGTFLMALAAEEPELAADVVCEMGTQSPLPANDQFRREVVNIIDSHYNMPVDRMDLQRGFADVMHIVRTYAVAVPQDFVLMGKAMVNISGVVLQLDPALNIAELAKPYGRMLVRQRLSPGHLKHSLATHAYHLVNLIRTAPRDMLGIMHKLRQGLFEFRVRHEGLERVVGELDRTGNRLSLSIILAAVIIASSSLLARGISPTIGLFGGEVSVLGLVGLLFGFILGAWLIVGIFRSGRL